MNDCAMNSSFLNMENHCLLSLRNLRDIDRNFGGERVLGT